MHHAANLVLLLHVAGVGIGDTATDEAICYYVELKLAKIFDAEDYKLIGKDFYNMIHGG